MAGWIILAVFIAAITGLLMIRIGVSASYESKQFSLTARVAGIPIPIIPKKETAEEQTGQKEKRKKKEKKQESEQNEEKDRKKGLPLGFSWEELLALAKDVLKRLGRFPRKICIDQFKLYLLVAGKDPYATAKSYGSINEALSILLPLAKNSFQVKRASVRTELDFIRDSMEAEAALSLSIRIGQILGIVFSIVGCALRALIKSKRRQRREARLEKKSLPSAPGASTEYTKENQQIEERMVANG